jgi:integrase
MPRRVKPLNAKQLESWRPDPIRTLELVDGAVPGLRVQLSPYGDRSWSLSVRVHNVRRRIALGKGLKLAEARRKAEQMRSEIAAGGDPTQERTALDDRRKAAAKGIGTLRSVIAAYFETGPGAGMRSGSSMRTMIERVFNDHLSRPALDVRSAELQLTIDGYRSKSSAQHAAAYARPLLRWAAKRGLLPNGDLLEAPPQAPMQQRVLTRVEVGRFWGELGWRTHDAAARFMLLSGARCGEVCGATWGEIDLETGQWTIPAARRKDTRPNARRTKEDVVPLSRQAMALLDTLVLRPSIRQEAGEGSYSRSNRALLIFSGERGAKLINWPRWSARMENRLGFDVTPHALRRTCATMAGDLGHAPHVVSALLGHRSIGGALLAGYNQSRYLAEVESALQMVADLLDALADGKDNVVAMVSKCA